MFYPAILCVCRQIFDEGYEILYHHNTAAAIIDGFDQFYTVGHLNSIAPKELRDHKFARRFTKWSITFSVFFKHPDRHILDKIRDGTSVFISKILSVIPNLNELKGRIELEDYDSVTEIGLDGIFVFANHLDLGDVAEQIFRPFSSVRVKNAEFVDQKGQPIRTTLSLSRLMMSDYPPLITLHKLYLDLIAFLEGSLSEDSHRVVTARLALLELASTQCDIDVFRFALRPLLDYLIHYRGLIPPQHLVEFAQDSATTATGIRWITDCTEKNQGLPQPA